MCHSVSRLYDDLAQKPHFVDVAKADALSELLGVVFRLRQAFRKEYRFERETTVATLCPVFGAVGTGHSVQVRQLDVRPIEPAARPDAHRERDTLMIHETPRLVSPVLLPTPTPS